MLAAPNPRLRNSVESRDQKTGGNNSDIPNQGKTHLEFADKDHFLFA